MFLLCENTIVWILCQLTSWRRSLTSMCLFTFFWHYLPWVRLVFAWLPVSRTQNAASFMQEQSLQTYSVTERERSIVWRLYISLCVCACLPLISAPCFANELVWGLVCSLGSLGTSCVLNALSRAAASRWMCVFAAGVCAAWSPTAYVSVCKTKVTYCYYLLLRDHSEDMMSALKAALCKHSVSTLMYSTDIPLLPSLVSVLFLHPDLSVHMTAPSLTHSCLHSVPKKELFRPILNVEPLIIDYDIAALIK